MDSRSEEMQVQSPELVLKEGSDAAEKKAHLLTLRTKRRNRSGKNKRHVSKSRRPPQTAKRQKSSETKSPPSNAPWCEEDENPKGKDKDKAIYDGYTVVNADDKTTIISSYHFCLCNIGALPLKKILKAWIKVIQPKKQRTYPYKGREHTAPYWWPPTTNDPKSDCRHIEPDHLHRNECRILAVWLLHCHDVDRLRRSTQQIAASVEERCKGKVRHLLESIYDLRKFEQGYEKGEHDGHSQISLNIPKDKVQNLLQDKPSEKPIYRYPESKRRACEADLIVAPAPLVSLQCNMEPVMDESFTMNLEAMHVDQPPLVEDVSYQQNTASHSDNDNHIGPGPELPYAIEAPYLSDLKSMRSAPPLSSDALGSALCRSLDPPVITSTIEAEQAIPIASGYYEHNIANTPNLKSTNIPTLLPADALRYEMHCKNAYRDTYDHTYLKSGPSLNAFEKMPGLPNSASYDYPEQLELSSNVEKEQAMPTISHYQALSDMSTSQMGVTPWPSNLYPVRDGSISQDLSTFTSPAYHQTPKFGVDYSLLAANYLYYLSQLREGQQ